MNIVDYELFAVPPRWLFLRVETADGSVGWGEPSLEGRTHTVRSALEELMDTYVLDAKDPFAVEDIWQTLYRGGFYRGGPVLVSAIAGIDQVLWDLEGPNVNQDVIEAGIKSAREQELDVPGLRPLVSDNFYEVDINAVDPDIDAENWSLSITGEVEESLTWDYEYLRALPAENRFVTLRCVSDDIHDLKMDNALWTGVHVRHVLDGAMPTSNCNCVRLHAEDGYYQVFPLEAFEDGMLAYGMNGKPLSRGHGYPVRTLVPGHWGEINVKWLTEIEFLNEDAEGYWEKRGWYGTGTVVPVAKLEVTQKREDGSRILGGHAYAGTRGVASVEVSTDGGDTWGDARLSDPLDEFNTPIGAHIDATDAWRQWSYEYAPPGGTYTVVVRLIDSNGNVQPSEERDPYPRGASGWASRELTN